jgi:hypothetical protein
MTEPVKTTVIRWKCPYCNRHRAKRAAMTEHIARCWKTPATKTCRTCVHLTVWPRGEYCFPGRPCSCNDESRCCETGVQMPEDGTPVVGCPEWLGVPF